LTETEALLDEAWRLSRLKHGSDFIIYHPGMFVLNGCRGSYHAVSITGTVCKLDCEHCGGLLLRNMHAANSPLDLVDFGMKAFHRGDKGILISGGCDRKGKLPWLKFLNAIEHIKKKTNLKVTIHTGQVDPTEAGCLKEAGVDQALVDVVGDDSTAREIFHLSEGTSTILKSMEALIRAGLEVVPHILYGIYYGEEKGEQQALEHISSLPLKKYVIIIFTPLKGTRMFSVKPPDPVDVVRFIARARLTIPDVKCSLGCARPGGPYRRKLDLLAIRAGINSLAIGYDYVPIEAQKMGLNVIRKTTCCSLD
jgi:lipoyl synthase